MTFSQLTSEKKLSLRFYRMHGIPLAWSLDDVTSKFHKESPVTAVSFTSLCKHPGGSFKSAVLGLELPLLEESISMRLEDHRVIIEPCFGLPTLFEPENGIPVTAEYAIFLLSPSAPPGTIISNAPKASSSYMV